MLLIGLALLLIGIFFAIHILYVIGIIALILGAAAFLLDRTGHSLGRWRW